MKKITVLAVALCLLLCLCSCSGNADYKGKIVGKWIDTKAETIFEYTEDGFYFEYLNEAFTSDKTRYAIDSDTITYYLDGQSPEEGFSVCYEFKGDNLIIEGEIEYKPMNLKTSTEEMEK